MSHLLTNVAEYAIILNEKNEFLLVQFGSDGDFMWHFPGGRMDDFDREISGLKRELIEEVAAEVTDIKPIFTKYISDDEMHKYDPECKGRYAVFYLAKLKVGCVPKLVTKDHVAMKWFSRADIPNIKLWLPFYKEMLEQVLPK